MCCFPSHVGKMFKSIEITTIILLGDDKSLILNMSGGSVKGLRKDRDTHKG